MPVSELHKIKKKKNFTVLAIIAFICVLIWAVTLIKIDRANAADIMSCGQPSTYDLNTSSPVPACDIYTRQLQYRDEAIKLRNQIQARAVNYARPSAILHRQYKENLQALHDSVTEDNIPSYFATWDEEYE